MSNVPAELKYSKEHEWLRKEADGTYTVGITEHAQELLGDMVFVDLPEVGATVSAGDDCAVAESVKAASDIYAPVSGEIVMSFPTGHAYGIKSDDGKEILIHIGMDTVELNGEGFDVKVKAGQRVKQGDVLVKVNKDILTSHGKSLVSPVVFTSGEKVELHKKNETITKNEKGFNESSSFGSCISYGSGSTCRLRKQ